jgi:hypothetical protein
LRPGEFRHRLAELLEVAAELGAEEAAAELDHGDALAASVEVAREVVELGDPRRRERRAPRLLKALVGDEAIRGRRLRTVVEAEDGFDRRRDRGGDVDVSGAAAVVALRRAVARQPRVERRFHPRGRSAEDDAAATGARLPDAQAALGREVHDRREILRRGAVAGRILAPGQIAPLPERLPAQLLGLGQKRARTHEHGHLDRLVGRDRADPTCSG